MRRLIAFFKGHPTPLGPKKSERQLRRLYGDSTVDSWLELRTKHRSFSARQIAHLHFLHWIHRETRENRGLTTDQSCETIEL